MTLQEMIKQGIIFNYIVPSYAHTKEILEKTLKADKKDASEASSTVRKQVAGDDKAVSKDDKGRTIYEGPRGGRYYINSNGNKTYISQDKN